MRSSSHTLLKYLSKVSTRQWMNSKIASSFCETIYGCTGWNVKHRVCKCCMQALYRHAKDRRNEANNYCTYSLCMQQSSMTKADHGVTVSMTRQLGLARAHFCVHYNHALQPNQTKSLTSAHSPHHCRCLPGRIMMHIACISLCSSGALQTNTAQTPGCTERCTRYSLA